MNTIDFDATVEFVWDWVAKLNAYLSQNGWMSNVKDSSAPRGLSDYVINEIADQLFQMVLKAEHPHRVMRALDIHLQSLINTNRSPALPDVYIEIKMDDDGNKGYRWNQKNFFTTLEKEVNSIVSKFEAFQTLGEQHFAATFEHSSTGEKKNKM